MQTLPNPQIIEYIRIAMLYFTFISFVTIGTFIYIQANKD